MWPFTFEISKMSRFVNIEIGYFRFVNRFSLSVRSNTTPGEKRTQNNLFYVGFTGFIDIASVYSSACFHV